MSMLMISIWFHRYHINNNDGISMVFISDLNLKTGMAKNNERRAHLNIPGNCNEQKIVLL